MDKDTEEQIKQIITKNGLLVSGNGILAENTKKMIEILDKIQKFIYFMEKRQTEMFDWMKENLKK